LRLATINKYRWQALVRNTKNKEKKSVDKTTKTMVVKTADGTEHTIKYTDDTTVKGAKDAGKSMEKASVDTYLAGEEGAKVTVKYMEKGGEETAVGIKDAGKATAKTVAQ
jgi:VCBS repeat-containing protein